MEPHFHFKVTPNGQKYEKQRKSYGTDIFKGHLRASFRSNFCKFKHVLELFRSIIGSFFSVHEHFQDQGNEKKVVKIWKTKKHFGEKIRQ